MDMCLSTSTSYGSLRDHLQPSRSRSFGSLSSADLEPPPCKRINAGAGYMPKGKAKVQSLVTAAIRVCLFPLFLLSFLWELPSRVVFNEPKGYRSPRRKGKSDGAGVASAVRSGYRRMRSTGISYFTAGMSRFAKMFPVEQYMEEEIKIVLGRFWMSTADSYMVTWQAIIYYSSLYFMWLLSLENVLFHWQKDIEWLLAKLAGAMYSTKEGETIPFSILSSMDPEYSVPYDVVGGFPFGPETDSAPNAHFMALCSKLVYEDGRIIKDMVENKWGMTFHDYFQAPAHWTRDCWVPDLVWFTCSNSRSLILTFKGADPLWQVNLKADPPISKSYYKSLRCHLHAGLMRGLGQANPYEPSETIFNTLIESLRSDGAGKQIFVCGHSLGGGLSALFSLLLHKSHKDLDRQIAGIFTFAAPRFGDKGFSRLFSELFAGRNFRYVNASDIVCKLPPGKGYAHPPMLRMITSYPQKTDRGDTRVFREEDGPALSRQWETTEDRLGYYYSAHKLWDSIRGVSGENFVRMFFRILLLATPGFSDHFPSDYERALREELSVDFADAAYTRLQPREPFSDDDDVIICG
eukprot:jgi/Botrbrau1/17221/Bobra.0799s0004.1